MNIPVSTYRVQLHREFTLRHLKEILPYLHQLGITTVYASPFFEAVPGSTHGYDVLNPHRINPELGTEEDLIEISEWLHEHRMTWLQDIVPNHMSSQTSNVWLYDVLEKGPFSPYYTFFDINWHHPKYPGQLMVPLLSKPLEELVVEGELTLTYDAKGLHFQYYEHSFPIDFRQYVSVLSQINEIQSAVVVPDYFIQSAQEFAAIQPDQKLDLTSWEQFKAELDSFFQKDTNLKVLREYSGHTTKTLDLLKTQNFCLAAWQEADKSMNYRRFFTVNELICLRMENEQTFAHYHKYIKSLIDKDIIQALRIDHIDGLYAPKAYLDCLHELVGEDTYVVVEKILAPNEYIPSDWKVQGTTGYDFLSLVNRLLVSDKSIEALSEFYSQVHVLAYDFEEAVYRKKLFMLIHHMGGELDNLTEQLVQLFPEYSITDEMRSNYRQVLAYWMVSFSVYRLYLDEKTLSEDNAKQLKLVFEQAKAKAKAPALDTIFEELRPILAPEPIEATSKELRFLMRTQQFTGPLMAKGVEDTTFYMYNLLISRNEVGDTPHIEENVNTYQFHQEMQKRPLTTLNATATHDTKRGEDVRLRINVLSEIVEEWKAKVLEWQKIAEGFRFSEGGLVIPDPNDEYFLYQTLVGTYPVHIDPENENYHSRLKEYITKVMKEAKVHTNWSAPDTVYEGKAIEFVDNLLSNQAFMHSFVPFVQRVANYGAVYSLTQTLIRLTAPGVPDTYQGTELWDFSMVDPDNRRPVNYQTRKQVLKNIVTEMDNPIYLQEKLKNVLDPSLKLFVLHKLLLLRRQYPELFLQGVYKPILTAGKHARKVTAFIREWKSQIVLVVFPLEVVSLCESGCLPVGTDVWEDTYLGWPEESDTIEYVNIFTHQSIHLSSRQPIGELLSVFPIGCWIKK
ncbi:malto-oligosyltrehalose synthase [Xanthocytophaga flava]|uniref:malto-oligosyltrehalose synthase n=1 Tax=Xanthocytophaga flava TaxID=3048013 RepID=UPI0028D9103C|nr:malto-oligosyltrehalose synthase [Xanthocytophaga flavus]MDJ1469845.1 malto-oligosyltrehalose synthase [Xanthocytophaga flavus]